MGVLLGLSIMMAVYAVIFGILIITVGRKMIKKLSEEKSNATLKTILAWIILIIGGLMIIAGFIFAVFMSISVFQVGSQMF